MTTFLEESERLFNERYFVLNSGQIILRTDIKEGVISPADTVDDIKSFISSRISLARQEGVKEGQERAVNYMKKHSRIKHSGLADEDGEWFCARWDVFESARNLK